MGYRTFSYQVLGLYLINFACSDLPRLALSTFVDTQLSSGGGSDSRKRNESPRPPVPNNIPSLIMRTRSNHALPRPQRVVSLTFLMALSGACLVGFSACESGKLASTKTPPHSKRQQGANTQTAMLSGESVILVPIQQSDLDRSRDAITHRNQQSREANAIMMGEELPPEPQPAPTGQNRQNRQNRGGQAAHDAAQNASRNVAHTAAQDATTSAAQSAATTAVKSSTKPTTTVHAPPPPPPPPPPKVDNE